MTFPPEPACYAAPHASHAQEDPALIYVATIVAPVCALLWLGLQSFERQRQAVQTLTTEKLEANPSDPRHILSVYGEGYKFVG